MNILFIYGNSINPNKGGVQRVTKVLADYFQIKGNNVFFLSLNKPAKGEYRDKRQFYLPNSKNFNNKINVSYLKEFIEKEAINIVINQGGLGKDCSKFAINSNKYGAKVISVLHSSPLASIMHFSSSKKDRFQKYKLDFLLPLTDRLWVKNILLWLYKLKYQAHFKRLCKSSDRVVLLSHNFRNEFNFFIGQDYFQEKIIAISNPCSFPLQDDIDFSIKEKALLYVGRIAFGQKRVDTLIRIWSKLDKDFPDWRLIVVGDGPDLGEAKKIANNLGCKRISFEGMQKPESYYERASIFCMTSSYEGFGLVLVEAQTYGVVPVAFNSFTSVTDIIINGESGFLVEPFDEKAYIGILSELMSRHEIRQSISKNCMKSAMKFSLEKIGDEWLELFEKLVFDTNAENTINSDNALLV